MASSPAFKSSSQTERPNGVELNDDACRTVHVHKISPRVRITPEARRYAIAELARRANVPESWQRQWTISIGAERTVVQLPEAGRIEFPHATSELLHDLSAGRFDCVKRQLLSMPGAWQKNLIPSFVVPFAKDGDSAALPLFRLRDHRSVECTVDLPLSILLTLSRWEEMLDTERDVHGRFSAKKSIAWKRSFLHRPIVDEYGLAFEEALRGLCPSLPRSSRKLRVKISHDADHIGLPFRLKSALRHTTHHHQPINSVRDILSLVSVAEPSDLLALRKIVSLSLERGLDSAVYWKASQPGVRDSGYDPRHQKVRAFIHWLGEKNVESGVQPGYETFQSPEKLHHEIATLREVLGNGPLGGRQHYLRWCPETWIHWETCRLAYDSSLSFADCIGFRSGTCWPYRPWLFSLNREADLLEIPLIVMDRTVLGYMGLSLDKGVEVVHECIERCRQVGGLFTMVWHNNNFFDPYYKSLYFRLLPLLWGGTKYDWRRDYSGIAASR